MGAGGSARPHRLGTVIAATVSTGTAALVALAVMASAMLLTRRWSAGRDHVMIAYGLGGLGLVSLLAFFVSWAHPTAGVIFSLLLAAGAVVHLALARAWRYWRHALPLAAVSAGILFAYLAMLGFRQSGAGDFYLVRDFVSGFTATPDNLLSFLVSDRIATGASTRHFLDNWNGSDRPPLLAGFILLVRALAAPWMGVQNAAFGASVVGQLLWVPAVFAFLRAVGASRRPALLAVLLVAATGSTLVNTLYTWPKLMSAALVLASGALLVEAWRRPAQFRRNFVGAVVLFALGMLSHGAAAFSVPFVVALGVVAYRRQRRRSILTTTGLAAVAGLLVYLPWMLYQRFVDPPGDRLLKWHLAGVIDEDSRSFFQAFVDSYGSLSPGEWLLGRLQNLATVFDLRLDGGYSCCADPLTARAAAEFYITVAGLGLSLFATIAILVVVAVRAARRRALRWEDRRFLLLVTVALACILFWCLVMFVPSSTVNHQGSHVWLLLLIAAPALWLGQRHPRLLAALVALQAVVTIVIYLPRNGAVDPLSFGVAAVAAVALAIAWRSSRRPAA